MGRFIDLTGQKFGKLIAVKRDLTYKKRTMWICKCECGNTTIVNSCYLRNGAIKSCGCSQGKSGKENNQYKHGYRHTKVYYIWKTMRQRCLNPNNNDYKYYGALGINICDEWDDPAAFCDWALKNGYKEGLTIDRKDTTKGYSPDNCRWITIEEQQCNKRSNHILTYANISYPMSVWSRKLNVNYSSLRDWIRKGKSFESFIKKHNIDISNILIGG